MRGAILWRAMPAGAALTFCLAAAALSAAAVESTGPDDIREIRGYRSPVRLCPWLLPSGGALVLAGTAALLVRGRRRQRRSATSPPSPLSSEEALDLLARRFAAGEELSLLYAELSGVVRRSLEERTGLPALRLTTEELLSGISPSEGVLPEEADRLRSLLCRCDLVKFAGTVPTGADLGEDLAAARAIITTAGEPPHGDTEKRPH